MSIVQTATTSFKVELPQGVHNFGPTSPDTFKIALYTAAADLGYATTVYSTSNEVTGAGYSAGGNTLTITTTPVAANNSSEGNKSVAVLDFGSDKTVNNDTFQIIFPTADANSAIVRIS